MKFLPLSVAFVGILLAVILAADTGRLGPLAEVYSFRYGDKAGHFVMLGMLTLLVDLALFQVMPRRSPVTLVLTAGLAIATLVSLEELSQLWIPRRNPDVFDLLASHAGIVTASLVALALRGQVSKPATRSAA